MPSRHSLSHISKILWGEGQEEQKFLCLLCLANKWKSQLGTIFFNDEIHRQIFVKVQCHRHTSWYTLSYFTSETHMRNTESRSGCAIPSHTVAIFPGALVTVKKVWEATLKIMFVSALSSSVAGAGEYRMPAHVSHKVCSLGEQ